MSEIRTMDRREVQYNGLFRVDEFATIIRKFLKARGYFPFEKKVQEDVFETGKQIIIEFDVFKNVNEYANAKMEISITVHGLRDKEITLGGHKQKYEQGNVSITIQPYLETDWRNQWEGKPFHFLMRIMRDKFIHRDFTSQMADNLNRDALDLSEEMRSYLNIIRFKVAENGRRPEPPA